MSPRVFDFSGQCRFEDPGTLADVVACCLSHGRTYRLTHSLDFRCDDRELQTPAQSFIKAHQGTTRAATDDPGDEGSGQGEQLQVPRTRDGRWAHRLDIRTARATGRAPPPRHLSRSAVEALASEIAEARYGGLVADTISPEAAPLAAMRQARVAAACHVHATPTGAGDGWLLSSMRDRTMKTATTRRGEYERRIDDVPVCSCDVTRPDRDRRAIHAACPGDARAHGR